ncbi:MAG: hypothetical protein FJW68_03765 [Actinobacteria bacterium]|nr:hypothetical protein [Actinomycetota bacterium]
MNKKIINKPGHPEKIISKSYTELIEAFKKDGCPICSLNRLNVDSYFSSILYECVNDPGVRKNLRSSLGYCRSHSIQFIQFVESSYNRFGASIIIADISSEVIKELDRLSKLQLKELKKIDITNHKCPACIYMQSHEHIYYSEIISNLENDIFLSEFIKSDGLCHAHLVQLMKIIKNTHVRNKIIESQKLKLCQLIKDMDEFVKKHSQQASGKITSDEAEAFKKAIRKISGSQSEFER